MGLSDLHHPEIIHSALFQPPSKAFPKDVVVRSYAPLRALGVYFVSSWGVGHGSISPKWP